METDQQKQPEKPSKEKRGCSPILVIILAILAIGGVGFGVFAKLSTKPKEITMENNCSKCEKPDSQSEQPTPKIDAASLSFSKNKDNSYILSVNTNYESDSERGWDSASVSFVNNELQLSTSDGTYQINNLHDKVSDIVGVDFGITADGGAFLFLMEDGTVEYIPMHDAYKNKKYESYGIIEGITNIIKFYNISYTRGLTVLAQDTDGNLYDLKDYIDNSLLYEN